MFPYNIPEYGDLMTLEVWLELVEDGMFTDYDGTGYISDGKMYGSEIFPSEKDRIPEGVTHIVWFNK